MAGKVVHPIPTIDPSMPQICVAWTQHDFNMNPPRLGGAGHAGAGGGGGSQTAAFNVPHVPVA